MPSDRMAEIFGIYIDERKRDGYWQEPETLYDQQGWEMGRDARADAARQAALDSWKEDGIWMTDDEPPPEWWLAGFDEEPEPEKEPVRRPRAPAFDSGIYDDEEAEMSSFIEEVKSEREREDHDDPWDRIGATERFQGPGEVVEFDDDLESALWPDDASGSSAADMGGGDGSARGDIPGGAAGCPMVSGEEEGDREASGFDSGAALPGHHRCSQSGLDPADGHHDVGYRGRPSCDHHPGLPIGVEHLPGCAGGHVGEWPDDRRQVAQHLLGVRSGGNGEPHGGAEDRGSMGRGQEEAWGIEDTEPAGAVLEESQRSDHPQREQPPRRPRLMGSPGGRGGHSLRGHQAAYLALALIVLTGGCKGQITEMGEVRSGLGACQDYRFILSSAADDPQNVVITTPEMRLYSLSIRDGTLRDGDDLAEDASLSYDPEEGCLYGTIVFRPEVDERTAMCVQEQFGRGVCR